MGRTLTRAGCRDLAVGCHGLAGGETRAAAPTSRMCHRDCVPQVPLRSRIATDRRRLEARPWPAPQCGLGGTSDDCRGRDRRASLERSTGWSRGRSCAPPASRSARSQRTLATAGSCAATPACTSSACSPARSASSRRRMLACGSASRAQPLERSVSCSSCARVPRRRSSRSRAGSRADGPGSGRIALGDLPACDVVVKHGLRVTTPARTLLDLAAVGVASDAGTARRRGAGPERRQPRAELARDGRARRPASAACRCFREVVALPR